jgi:hypothetical protein
MSNLEKLKEIRGIIEAKAQAGDKVAKMYLAADRLREAFGLRAKESLMTSKVYERDGRQYLQVEGSKGGRTRDLLVKNKQQQKAVQLLIETAKALGSGTGRIIPPAMSLKQAYHAQRNLWAKLGGTRQAGEIMSQLGEPPFRSGFFKIALAALISFIASTAQADMSTEANNLFSFMSGVTGNPNMMNMNLIMPLLNSNKQMTSFDGKTKFSTSMFNSSGSPLLVVQALLSTATGDLTSITVSQDPAGTGNITSATVFPIPGDGKGQVITSFCQEGYVQCDPGTGQNCQFRQWTVDQNGVMGATAASSVPPAPAVTLNSTPSGAGSISALSGCYCFDYICSKNNNALINIDDIAAYAGGSIVAAYLTGARGTAITGTSNTGSGQITYYGTKTASNAPGSNLNSNQAEAMPVMSNPNVTNLQQYYSDTSVLSSMASSALGAQQTTPNSMYSIVSNMSSSSAGTTPSCQNSDNIAAVTVQRSDSQSGTAVLCVDEELAMVLTQTNPTSWAFGEQDFGPGANCSGVMGNNCGAIPFNSALNTYGRLLDTYTFSRPAATYNYQITSVTVNTSQSGAGCSPANSTTMLTWNSTQNVGTPDVACTTLDCGYGGAQQPTVSWTWDVNYLSQEIQESLVNGCQTYDNNPNCTLMSVSNDGCPLMLNGMTSGTCSQTNITLQGEDGLPNLTVQRPYHVQTRTYNCTNTNNYANDINTNIVGGSNTVINSAKALPGSQMQMQYSDASGKSYTGSIPGQLSTATCPQVCETKIPTPQSALVGTGASKSAQLTTPATDEEAYQYFYHDCTQDSSGNYTCPTDPTQQEQIVAPCGCSTDFGVAVSSLMSASLAKNAICSSVTQP